MVPGCRYGVFLDAQTVIEAVRNFAGTEKFAVSLLDGPETKVRNLQAVLSFFRWHPAEFKLEMEAPLEIVASDKAKFADIRAALAAQMEGGEEAGEGGGFEPEDVGLAKKSYSMDSLLDVPDQDWDPARPRVQRRFP